MVVACPHTAWFGEGVLAAESHKCYSDVYKKQPNGTFLMQRLQQPRCEKEGYPILSILGVLRACDILSLRKGILKICAKFKGLGTSASTPRGHPK